ncbi:hypothetical protein [Fibrella aquatilis]|uniref:Outer membrane protein beta-barrel domain-containing protein n=1 Tax=Fibrella aquatilis TaxID=2817059 RepID=A0A939G6D4_9BACT|nr:hypothetical protein [Fibrella aquatilis]MBO0933237.1 hypothetical protein [Fibrella aquatilis]
MNRNHFYRCFPGGLALLLLPLLAYRTTAQGAFGVRSSTDRNQAGIGIGIEPELTTSAGYNYRVSRLPNPLQFRVGAGLLLPPYLAGQGSVRLNGLVALDWQPAPQPTGRGWCGRLALLPYYAHNRNDASTLDGLGLDVRLLPLRRSNRWAGGLDLGWQATLLTHVQHSDRVKGTFTGRYPASEPPAGQPRDGWYRGTAHRFRLGYTSAWAMGQRWSGQVSAGTLVGLQRQGVLLSFAHGQVPVYLETTINVGW